jgi:hypothetical protein
MEWNVYRAPTDNDQYVNPKWTEAGYDRPTVKVYSANGEACPEGGAVITCHLGIAALTVAPFVDASQGLLLQGGDAAGLVSDLCIKGKYIVGNLAGNFSHDIITSVRFRKIK